MTFNFSGRFGPLIRRRCLKGHSPHPPSFFYVVGVQPKRRSRGQACCLRVQWDQDRGASKLLLLTGCFVGASVAAPVDWCARTLLETVATLGASRAEWHALDV